MVRIPTLRPLEPPMDDKVKAATDAFDTAGADQKAQIGGALMAKLAPAAYNKAFAELFKDAPNAGPALAEDMVEAAPKEQRQAMVQAALKALTVEEQKQVTRGLLGAPSDKTRDRLWLFVIVALVSVMLGAVLVLAINSFMPKTTTEMRVS